MRYIFFITLLCSAVAVFGAGEIDSRPTQPKEEKGIPTNYDDVIQDLVACLGKDLASAQDAAIKLGSLGKRSLPALNDALNANYGKEKGNVQVVQYATVALARIKSADAARTLLPIISNVKAPYELRCAALTAVGLEYLDEAVPAIVKIAVSDPEIDIRRKAYSRLMTLAFATTATHGKEADNAARAQQWQAVEQVFINALNDPDTEIRTIAAKQCYFAAKIYRDAAPILITAAENETVEAVRSQVFLALGSMQAREAVPTLMRIYQADETSDKMRKLALNAINRITTYDFKDKAALMRWWEKSGQTEYTKYEQLMKKLQEGKEPKETGDGAQAAAPTPAPAATPATPPAAPVRVPEAPTNPPNPPAGKPMPSDYIDGGEIKR